MKKVLVIEDWEGTKSMMRVGTLDSPPVAVVEEIFNQLKAYELKDVVQIEAKVDRLYDQMPEFRTVLLTKQPKGWSAEIQDSFGFKKDDPLIVLVAKKQEGSDEKED